MTRGSVVLLVVLLGFIVSAGCSPPPSKEAPEDTTRTRETLEETATLEPPETEYSGRMYKPGYIPDGFKSDSQDPRTSRMYMVWHKDDAVIEIVQGAWDFGDWDAEDTGIEASFGPLTGRLMKNVPHDSGARGEAVIASAQGEGGGSNYMVFARNLPRSELLRVAARMHE